MTPAPVAPNKRGCRFTIRSTLLAMAWVALALACYTTFQTNLRRSQQEHILYQRAETLESLQENVYAMQVPRTANSQRGFLSGRDLDLADFSGVNVVAGSGAFQSTSMVGANFSGATITVGGASFQHTKLDGADLRGATITVGSSSLQITSFQAADLRGAVIVTPGGATLQYASFRDADLSSATIDCQSDLSSFQEVDINGVEFAAADLTGIHADGLTSAYFWAPPSYDDRTKFPADFDPQRAGWKRRP
ncbi:Pentapeptide repeats (8 copies) [Rubripirellula lacrimiformis]|uniref:Pentapeptide repeats (8 copies) n=1 Tax=Rubripirellula lacrimiformis TaxID=1930273 RepID=A0A517NKD8_9BACT|nr:pentapeptide repeat-containing protein [Rubripirellula lacrimiformis]QDT07607.1 Pentapeptide repeats (8 copies) [Rubripirellula lacrimiformis]